MGKHHELIVDLRRNSPNEPWGFSLVGGADVKTPLIVTRVAFGSPAQGGLQRGDIITKVGNYDSRDIRHEDAQNLFRNAGSNVRLVVQRETAPRQNASTGSSRNSSHYSPLSVSPNLSPRGPGLSPGYSPAGSALTPVYTSPLTPIDNNYFEPYEYGQRKRDGNEDGEVHVMKQPYRTTPLVLPGAKVKREPGPTESYLRHHPNPSVRAPPHHLDYGHKLVHKQFNSPINVYSEPNILDTIHRQTGVQAPKRHVKFNPAESATYQYLQEEEMGGYGAPVQEVVTPPQSKIYTPTKKAANVVNTNNPQYLNAIGQDPEVIQQSGSFKRLMMSVLPGSNF
ncbi:PDZ and LIM domain protein 2 isoform X2 [Anthonomus grandis grandis]|uniref:PDZ and LIM domain protein 2 isoform X2 n=1 Tax=Anthonomus grandis grandis TaxID=2921223 RepID=UPI002165E7CA|nr:PDZ and LIM domain protein 2 isoform X2 [Anthonomus grandis grandis]